MLDRIQQRAQTLRLGRALAWLIAAPPLALGYLVGTAVKLVKLVWAAFLEGFETGVKL